MALTGTAIKNAQPADKLQKLSDGGGLQLHIATSTLRRPHKTLRYLGDLIDTVTEVDAASAKGSVLSDKGALNPDDVFKFANEHHMKLHCEGSASLCVGAQHLAHAIKHLDDAKVDLMDAMSDMSRFHMGSEAAATAGLESIRWTTNIDRNGMVIEGCWCSLTSLCLSRKTISQMLSGISEA